MSDDISREDALLWLNDRLGQRMLISVGIDCGDYLLCILSAVGALQHSSARLENPVGGHVGAALREEFVGFYAIGGCDFEIADSRLARGYAIREIPRPEVAKLPGASELVVRLRGEIEVTITPVAVDAVSGG